MYARVLQPRVCAPAPSDTKPHTHTHTHTLSLSLSLFSRRYEALKSKISGYLATGAEDGLIHHKAPLSQRKIANRLSSGGFLLYPTSRAEVCVCVGCLCVWGVRVRVRVLSVRASERSSVCVCGVCIRACVHVCMCACLVCACVHVCVCACVHVYV